MSYSAWRAAPMEHDRPASYSSLMPLRDDALASTRNYYMLKWAVIFAVIAVIAGVFGFTGIAAGAAGIAKILFIVFLVLFVAVVLFALLGVGSAVRK